MSDDIKRKKTWERRLNTAKKKHRPKLSNWERDSFACNHTIKGAAFQLYKRQASSKSLCGYRDIDNPINRNSVDTILQTKIVDRIHCSNMTQLEFIHYFEEPAIPCIIRYNHQYSHIISFYYYYM